MNPDRLFPSFSSSSTTVRDCRIKKPKISEWNIFSHRTRIGVRWDIGRRNGETKTNPVHGKKRSINQGGKNGKTNASEPLGTDRTTLLDTLHGTNERKT